MPDRLSYEAVLKNPELLLYRRVNHLFNCDGTDTWYQGTVLSYNEETGEFRVAYDEEDEVFVFRLSDDINNGDLQIIG